MNKTGRCSFTMNGQKVDLLFGMPACERFYSDIAQGNVLMDEEGNILSSTGISFLLMAGYWNDCVYNNRVAKLKISDFMDYLEQQVEDEQFQNELTEVSECFKNSISVIKFLERKNKELDEQKKRIADLST